MFILKTASPKTKKSSNSLSQPILIVAGALIFILGWWGVSYYLNHHSLQAGTLESNFTDQKNIYKDLNLSQARQARYFNKPITIVKDLGTTNGAHHKLIKFGVPKDNLTEFALLTTPAVAAPAKGYPVIILCHGYANPRTYSTTEAYLSDMEFYSQHGFAVIKPDFRGQGLSLTSGSSDSAFYSMSYNTDALSLIAAVEQTSTFDKSAISLWGHSMGAYIALRAAVLSPIIKHVIILAGPVGTVDDMFSDYVAVSDAANPIAAAVRSDMLAQHGTPLSNPDFWKNTSPLNYLRFTNAYIQIHIGDSDKTVPPRFSADLDAALKATHKKHDYFIYEGAGHGLVPQRPIIWQRSLTVLNGSV